MPRANPIAPLLVIFSILLLVTIGLLLRQASPGPQPAASLSKMPAVTVYFSPNGGCTDAIVEALGQAQSSVFIQAYSFTSKPIAQAVVDAHKRGVQVEAILDKSQRTEHYSAADFLAHMGVTTYIDAAHAIAHNKIIIIDERTVITGSFNFTKAAEEKNAENLLILRDASLAARYHDNWNAHKEHSEPYAGR